MSLSDSQLTNCRRFAGYPALADAPASDTSDDALIFTRRLWQTLQHRLTNLTPDEEAVLVDTYLTNIATLESGQLEAVGNIDTNAAGTWVANPKEISDRRRLFNMYRRDMCAFLGVEPGPGLGAGGITLVRG